MPWSAVMSSVVKPSRRMKPWKSAANSSAPGSLPSLTLVAISHADAALTRSTFEVSAIASRATSEATSYATAAEAAANRSASDCAAITVATATSEAGLVATASVKPAASIKPATEPRAGANEDATVEPIWTVVAVRRARVRVISIVAVGAHWSWAIVARTVSKSEADPNLRMCVRR